MHAMKANQSD